MSTAYNMKMNKKLMYSGLSHGWGNGSDGILSGQFSRMLNSLFDNAEAENGIICALNMSYTIADDCHGKDSFLLFRDDFLSKCFCSKV